MTSALIENDPFATDDFEPAPIDGTGNNLGNPDYGVANAALLNAVPLDYTDGFSTPAGTDRPNPREISNTVSVQEEDIPDPRGLTDFIWAWGQFLDHDLGLTPELSAEEAEAQGRFINVPVPAGDPFLDPDGTGEVEIEIRDFVFIEGTGTDASNPRQLPNVITAFIDGSNIYGSDEERTNFLRSFEGGRLDSSEGNLLLFNDGTLENDNPTNQDPANLFVSGDARANENSVLTSLHTLMMREHNRLAEELATAHPDWTDEQLFQRARQINVAQMQAIVYNEYLPALLGNNPLPEYSGYDPTINPGINRIFSTAAFRLGHTQLSSEILRLDPSGEEIPEGNLTLSEVFFPGGMVLQDAGIDPILRGIAASNAQQVDVRAIEDVRSFLFGFGTNASARDLVAINIQRGRHNGIADYNTVREAFGLDRVTNFAEITSDADLQNSLEQLYGSVDDIDAWIGMMAEDLLPGASVGETLFTVLQDQFLRLRDGDRFYYENVLTPEEINEIDRTRLSDIIVRNTDTEAIQDNVFFVADRFNFDVDNNGKTEALSDGVLVLRYLSGLTGDALTGSAIGAGADRNNADDIIAYLDPVRDTVLDVDGNGEADALNDGILIARYLFGLTGESLIQGAIASDATRTAATDIVSFLQDYDLVESPLPAVSELESIPI